MNISNLPSEFKTYKRKLIQINRDTVILLHRFNKELDHAFEDLWLEDNDAFENEMYNLRKDAAKQFIAQFEGNECIAFIKALREECDNYLTTKFNKLKQIEEIYENRSNK